MTARALATFGFALWLCGATLHAFAQTAPSESVRAAVARIDALAAAEHAKDDAGSLARAPA